MTGDTLLEEEEEEQWCCVQRSMTGDTGDAAGDSRIFFRSRIGKPLEMTWWISA
jgi:hypothetical protein